MQALEQTLSITSDVLENDLLQAARPTAGSRARDSPMLFVHCGLHAGSLHITYICICKYMYCIHIFIYLFIYLHACRYI